MQSTLHTSPSRNHSVESPHSKEEASIYLPPGRTIISLDGLLSKGRILLTQPDLYLLTLLTSEEEDPERAFIKTIQFTQTEWHVLLPVLVSYPDYCPYEVLRAAFNTAEVTQATLETARKRLIRAREQGTWEDELRPVRNVLSRTRLKLHHLNITITSILETGVLLQHLVKAYGRSPR